MKKFLGCFTLLTLLAGTTNSIAQSKILDRSDFLLTKQKNFDDKEMDALKNTKTVFFQSRNNSAQNDSIKTAIASVWDLTPIIFDDISNFDKYAGNPAYSYFEIRSTTHTSTMGSMSTVYTHYFLTLALYESEGKKGKINTTDLCRVELFVNSKSKIGEILGRKREEQHESLYSKGNFHNWTPMLLKAQLAAVQTNFKNKMRAGLNDGVKDDDLSRILSKDTLYVPKNLLFTFNAFTGAEKNDREDVFSGYQYKYKLCDDEELYRIFEVEKRGRLLFEYVKSSSNKYVTIYDMKTKKVIYRDYTAISYNLKSKDLEKIN